MDGFEVPAIKYLFSLVSSGRDKVSIYFEVMLKAEDVCTVYFKRGQLSKFLYKLSLILRLVITENIWPSVLGQKSPKHINVNNRDVYVVQIETKGVQSKPNWPNFNIQPLLCAAESFLYFLRRMLLWKKSNNTNTRWFLSVWTGPCPFNSLKTEKR